MGNVPRGFASGGWARVGPGRGIEFNATDEELNDILLKSLADEYAPYNLITIQSHKVGRLYEWTAHEHDVRDLIALCKRGEWFFFICSHTITPRVDLNTFESLQKVCSLSGMINLQHNHEIGATYRSSLGIVWKIGNLKTYEVIVHAEYLKIFERLQRAFRRLRRKRRE